MKQFLYGLVFFLVIVLLAGCDLINNPKPPIPPPAIGRDLTINELFTISPDRYYTYSWIELYNPTNHKIPWAHLTTPLTAVTYGANGAILKTTDDGSSWTTSTSNTSGSVNGMQIVSPVLGYAVGEGGTILKTVDSGSTWQSVVTNLTPPLTANLNDIAYPSIFDLSNTGGYSPVGDIVGDNGTILHTQDLGNTWVYQNSGTTNNLNGVAYVRSNRFYACGDAGTLLYTIDGGFSWHKATNSASVNFHSISAYVHISGPRTSMLSDSVWAAGDGGQIYHSFSFVDRNSAINFVPETTHTTANLYGISFPDSGNGNGWAVGAGGTVLHSSNYGKAWKKQKSNVTADLHGVRFLDSLRGMAFGDNGTLIYTADGGDFWTPIPSGTSQRLNGSFFIYTGKEVQDYYTLHMRAIRKHFLFTLTPFVFNPDYYVKIDTGDVVYNPSVIESFRGVPGLATGPGGVPAGGFVVINSDSGAFADHTKLGPGSTDVENASILIAPGIASSIVLQFAIGGDLVKWDLLPSGDIQLIKYHDEIRRFPNPFPGQPDIIIHDSHDSTIIDELRYGNYRPSPDPYPQNAPAPYIPEWWSLSRYQNDINPIDPNKNNSAYSFYLTSDPIPGWGSQRTH